MDEAVAQNVPARRYSEEARAQIKEHLERAVTRRGVHRAIDWETLWGELEMAAWVYDRSVASLALGGLGIGDTIDGLVECGKLITALIRKLEAPALWDWNFISDSTDPWCRLVGHASSKFKGLAKQLTAARERVAEDIKALREFADGQKIRIFTRADCKAQFKEAVLEIGQGYLGPRVGGDDGPLVTFLVLASRPVLEDDTPDNEALRKFAHRHKREGQEG